jgi:hypothetical protein
MSLKPIHRDILQLGALLLVVLGLSGFVSVDTLLAPSADLWPRWTANDPANAAHVDHVPWDRFLERYTRRTPDGSVRVAYGDVSEGDSAVLTAYIARLAAIPTSTYSRPEQRAYWINLYNALTVRVVLDHYPVKSIRDIDISPGLFDDGPWDKPLVEVEGQPVTLNDIEHRILRPIWGDPRLHYALNCAAIGCPDLQQAAFTVENTDRLLDAGARAYINSPRGVHFDAGDLIVSSIYAWYAEDFGGSDAAILDHLRRYAAPDLAESLSLFSEIDGHDYDWALNDARRRQ